MSCGDTCRIYEINAEVGVWLTKHFTYLADSKAKVDVILGDARLSLEQEASNQFSACRRCFLLVTRFRCTSSQEAVPKCFMTKCQQWHRGLPCFEPLSQSAAGTGRDRCQGEIAGGGRGGSAQADNALHSSSTYQVLAHNADALKGNRRRCQTEISAAMARPYGQTISAICCQW